MDTAACDAAMSMANVSNVIMDPESDLVNDAGCYNNNYLDPTFTSDSSTRMVPSSIVVINKIGGVVSKKPLRCLYDPCSTCTHVYKKALPPGAATKATKKSHNIEVLNSVTSVDRAVSLDDIVMPEFSPTRHITTNFNALVVDNPKASCDIIFGDDFLRRVKLDPLPSLWRGVCVISLF